MYYENDYILRMIHDSIRMLAKLLGFDISSDTEDIEYEIRGDVIDLRDMIDRGLICEAENLLSDLTKPYDRNSFLLSMYFYDYVNEKDDAFLAEHNFSREEIIEGIKKTLADNGYEDMLDLW